MTKEYALLYPRPDGAFEATVGLPFNTILKEAREKKGMGIRELSRTVECSHVYLMKIERGERTPAPKLLNKLQKALGLEPFFLVPRDEFQSGGAFGDTLIGVPAEKEEHGLSYLLGSLLSALRRGEFDPSIGGANAQEKAMGVVSKIHLGSAQKFEILIKAN